MDPAFLGVAGAPTFDLTGLQAYYKFNEASGDIINVASSPIANSDLVVTGATFGVTGIIGDAVSLDGVNDALVASNAAAGAFNFIHNLADDFSMNFWMKLTDRTQTTTYLTGTGAFGGTQIGMDLWYSNRTFNYEIKEGVGKIIDIAAATFYPDDANFHMITLRFDPNVTTDSAKLTLDGDTGGQTTGNKSGTATNSNHDQDFRIGEEAGTFTDLDVDETSMWSRLLTDQEISDLFNGGSGLEL